MPKDYTICGIANCRWHRRMRSERVQRQMFDFTFRNIVAEQFDPTDIELYAEILRSERGRW